MLPIKWQIFRIVNYLIAAATIGIAFINVYRLTQEVTYPWVFQPSDYFLLAFLLTLFTNSLFNILILEKNFPTREISKGLSITLNVFFVLSIIIIILFSLAVTAVIYKEFNNSGQNITKEQIGSGILLMLMLFPFYYVLIFQKKLKRLIKKNHQAELENAFAEGPN